MATWGEAVRTTFRLLTFSQRPGGVLSTVLLFVPIVISYLILVIKYQAVDRLKRPAKGS